MNVSHLWQYIVIGLGQNFYAAETERAILYDHLSSIQAHLHGTYDASYLEYFLSRVLFKLESSMWFNDRNYCSWDFADRRIPCQPDWFITTKTIHGNCHTFNHNGSFHQVGRGPGAGLRININVHNDLNSGRQQNICKLQYHYESYQTLKYKNINYISQVCKIGKNNDSSQVCFVMGI